MTEATKNKVSSSTIRLPDELRAALRREVAPYYARDEEPPSFGDILLEAWRRSRAVPAQGALSIEQSALVETFIRLLQSDDAATKQQMLAFLKSWDSKHPSEVKDEGRSEEKATGTRGRNKR